MRRGYSILLVIICVMIVSSWVFADNGVMSEHTKNYGIQQYAEGRKDGIIIGIAGTIVAGVVLKLTYGVFRGFIKWLARKL